MAARGAFAERLTMYNENVGSERSERAFLYK
jgi:hypothetical protein